jgi:hypothetical protein
MSGSDIPDSFTFLHKNIPQWLRDLTDIEAKAASLQNEISRVPVSKSPPMKRRSNSVESLRDIYMTAIPEEQSTQPSAQQDSSQLPRKRKIPSVVSAHASGPSKYRSRTMIVVQYDGQMQKSFEKMFRDIGTGRNLLRKAKMAARMDALAELAAESSNDEEDDDPMSKISYRHRSGLASIRAARTRDSLRGFQSGGSSSAELFDTTDKSLELAQGLCETGAHQSLRDGDCRKELNGVRKHLETVLEIAKREVAKYPAKKEELKEDGKVESVPLPTEIEPKLVVVAPKPVPVIAIDNSKIMEIEVDDESDDEDFIMPPIRLTSRLTARV